MCEDVFFWGWGGSRFLAILMYWTLTELKIRAALYKMHLSMSFCSSSSLLLYSQSSELSHKFLNTSLAAKVLGGWLLCSGLKKESKDKSLKEGDMDGNRVGVALVSTVTVDGEVPGMKVEGKQTSPLRWQQHSNWFSFPVRTGRKKHITRSPSSPGDTVRCCIRKQEAGRSEHAPTNMHSRPAHAHKQTSTCPHAHARITCSTSPCSRPSLSCSPTLPPKHLQHVKPA